MILGVWVGVIVKVEGHIWADAPIDAVAKRAHLRNCQRKEENRESSSIYLDGEKSVRDGATVFQYWLRCHDGYNP